MTVFLEERCYVFDFGCEVWLRGFSLRSGVLQKKRITGKKVFAVRGQKKKELKGIEGDVMINNAYE